MAPPHKATWLLWLAAVGAAILAWFRGHRDTKTMKQLEREIEDVERRTDFQRKAVRDEGEQEKRDRAYDVGAGRRAGDSAASRINASFRRGRQRRQRKGG